MVDKAAQWPAQGLLHQLQVSYRHGMSTNRAFRVHGDTRDFTVEAIGQSNAALEFAQKYTETMTAVLDTCDIDMETFQRALIESGALHAGGSIARMMVSDDTPSVVEQITRGAVELDFYVSSLDDEYGILIDALYKMFFFLKTMTGAPSSEDIFSQQNHIAARLSYAGLVNRRVNINVMVLNNGRMPLDVVQNFELTCCQIWYDGQSIHCTHPSNFQLESGFRSCTMNADYVPSFLQGSELLRNVHTEYSELGFRVEHDTSIQALNDTPREHDCETMDVQHFLLQKMVEYVQQMAYDTGAIQTWLHRILPDVIWGTLPFATLEGLHSFFPAYTQGSLRFRMDIARTAHKYAKFKDKLVEVHVDFLAEYPSADEMGILPTARAVQDASRHGDPDIVQILLAAGAPATARAAEDALRIGHLEIVQLLEDNVRTTVMNRLIHDMHFKEQEVHSNFLNGRYNTTRESVVGIFCMKDADTLIESPTLDVSRLLELTGEDIINMGDSIVVHEYLNRDENNLVVVANITGSLHPYFTSITGQGGIFDVEGARYFVKCRSDDPNQLFASRQTTDFDQWYIKLYGSNFNICVKIGPLYTAISRRRAREPLSRLVCVEEHVFSNSAAVDMISVTQQNLNVFGDEVDTVSGTHCNLQEYFMESMHVPQLAPV